MTEAKFRTFFLAFFFFFQGVFLTGMILLVLFDHKVIPVIREKNVVIEKLADELNEKYYNERYCTDGIQSGRY